MKIAVIQFPGSNCDLDACYAFSDGLDTPAGRLWHKDASIGDADAVVLPGGFSYGDYLRCGAIARFSPVMRAVVEFAAKGGLVLGICNGFQILCEAGLLPGALVRNAAMEFVCETPELEVLDSTGRFNPQRLGATLRLPIAHGEGNYRIDPDGLEQLQRNRQILFRYRNNPNGSVADIAGIRNETGNVFGMMPHPERAVDPLHPSTDGLSVLQAFLRSKPLAVS